MSIFEIAMLLSFGFAWPFSIVASYTARTAKGKSILFLSVVLIGYISGILHKIVYAYDFVIFFYILNFIMVFIDLLLYFRNKRYDRLKQANTLIP